MGARYVPDRDLQARQGLLRRALDNDLVYSYMRSPLVLAASAVTLIIFFCAAFAEIVAPHDPFNPATLSLMDASTPPAWVEGGNPTFLLGTDIQGRDMLSSIMYGARISIIVALAAVALGMTLGVVLGLIAGYVGGWFDAVIMRLADVQLTIPSILMALMLAGIVSGLLPREMREEVMIYVVILAIGINDWPQFARVTRGATMVEMKKEYVAAARVIGINPVVIMIRHVLPNVVRPTIVIATIGLALAIITEATLSFLGAGVPPTTPSLGTLIRIGNEYLFSGEWWITLFPSLALVALVLSVNLLGDWLRDALNPKLR